MAEADRSERQSGVGRFLTDFRTGTDRRSAEDRRERDRRDAPLHVVRDRRDARDRRDGADRRGWAERRRPLGEQFSFEDAQRIGEMVKNAVLEAACPKCDGNLLRGPRTSHEGVSMQEVHCTHCRRNALLVDVA